MTPKSPGLQFNGSSVHLCAASSVAGSPHYLFTTHFHVRVMFISAFCLPFLLPPDSPFSASKFLEQFEKEFLEVVHVKQSLLELKRKGVIPPNVATAIDTANEDNTKYLLFEHLAKNVNENTLREYCKVAIAADGFPKMQALGRKMMAALPSGGWLVMAVNVHGLVPNCIVHACVPLPHCV